MEPLYYYLVIPIIGIALIFGAASLSEYISSLGDRLYEQIRNRVKKNDSAE